MKRLIARFLRWLAGWFDDWTPIHHRAAVLTAEQDRINASASGEAKRHQVYARLIKDFPTVPKRVLAQIIEEVL